MKPTLKKQLFTVGTFVRINTRRFFRDRLALFFTIGFPLIFLFVFGGLNSGSGDVSFNVALLNHSDTSFAKDFVKNSEKGKILKVNKEVTDLDTAKEKMSRSEIDATIVLPVIALPSCIPSITDIGKAVDQWRMRADIWRITNGHHCCLCLFKCGSEFEHYKTGKAIGFQLLIRPAAQHIQCMPA